jgi:hypothetical protein
MEGGSIGQSENLYILPVQSYVQLLGSVSKVGLGLPSEHFHGLTTFRSSGFKLLLSGLGPGRSKKDLSMSEWQRHDDIISNISTYGAVHLNTVQWPNWGQKNF